MKKIIKVIVFLLLLGWAGILGAIKKRKHVRTWWILIRDHQNKVVYFQDMDKGCLCSSDLKKLNLTNNAPVLRIFLAGDS